MAITRMSGAQILQTYAGTAAPSTDYEGYALHRLDTGRMAGVWKSLSGSTSTLNVATLDPLGLTHTAISALDAVATTRSLSVPRMASTTAGGFFATWEDDATAVTPLAGNTLGRTFSAAGTALTSKAHTSISSTGGEYTPSVARLGNGNFLVSWADTLDTAAIPPSSEIMARIYSPAGVAIGSEFRLNTTTAGVQYLTDSLSLADGRSLVVWGNAVVSGYTLAATELRGRFVSDTGAATGVDFQIDTIAPGREYQDKGLELVSLGNGGFAVIWEEEAKTSEEIHFQRFTAAGAKAGGEVVVESVTGTPHIMQLITTELANGGFAIAWRVFDSAANTVTSHVRSFTGSGVETGTEVSLNTIAAPGLSVITDLELMADGHVMALGVTGKSVATQVFDFGDERLLGTTAADTLYGKHGVHDVILGGAGNDIISGFSGNDVISGEAGLDRLTGGGGYDIFVFNTALSATLNVDTLTDFNVAADTIKLENAIFTGLGTTVGGLAAVKFYVGTAAHDADDRIIYDKTSGALLYDSDGLGGAAAVKFAIAPIALAMTSADFIVI